MNKYVVALLVGGLMEQPEIYYTDGDIIEARNKKEAVEIYNEKNNCDYFYGDVVAKKTIIGWKILNHKVTKIWFANTMSEIHFKNTTTPVECLAE